MSNPGEGSRQSTEQTLTWVVDPAELDPPADDPPADDPSDAAPTADDPAEDDATEDDATEVAPAEVDTPQGNSGEAELRLDKYVAQHLDRPRNRVQQWIRDGRVQVNGKVGKASTPVRAGNELCCRIPPPEVAEIQPEEGALEILYQDEHLVIVNKPAGMVVHPGAGRPTGSLAHRLLHHFPEMGAVGGRGRPGLVHRLDLDTTGALIAARTEEAYLALVAAFAARQVDKHYVALAFGKPKEEAGRIDAPIGRHGRDRTRMVVRRGGRDAKTRYRRRASIDSVLTIFDLSIETGRTHQIRVHLKALGHPLIGDNTYGEARWKGAPKATQRALKGFPRPALHALGVRLHHPISGQALEVKSPEPADIRQLWADVGGGPWPAPVDL